MTKRTIRILILVLFISSMFFFPVKETFAICPPFPTHPTATQILGYINGTKLEDLEGACTLGALTIYNSSGTLAAHNISVNITALNKTFFAGHPVLPTANSILSNYTTITIEHTGLTCIKITPKSQNASNHSINVHVHFCNPGWLKTSQLVLNITAPNTTITLPNDFLSFNGTINLANKIKINTTKNQGSNDTITVADGLNWAGYALESSGNNVTSVSGSWVVEPALRSPKERVAAQWVGVGGVNGTAILNISGIKVTAYSFVQIGTSSCYKSIAFGCGLDNSTGASYGAWAIFQNPTSPALGGGVQLAPLTNVVVRSGDIVAANITQFGARTWVATLTDTNTTTHTTTRAIFIALDSGIVTMTNNTAEWIDERPLICGACYGYKNFTNFINASFSSSHAVINGLSSNIQNQANGQFTAHTFSINASIDNFAVPSILTNSDEVFNVSNFRIGALCESLNPLNPLTLCPVGLSSPLVAQGEPFFIASEQTSFNNKVAFGAVGGTGIYSYQWLESIRGESYTNSTMCTDSTTPYCNVSTSLSTPVGNYSFELMAHAVGGPADERLNTTPINITVIAPPPVACPGIVNSVNVRLSNDEPVATGPDFQQMINVPSATFAEVEDPSLQNVRFFYPENCTTIPAWIESGAYYTSPNTAYWLKLPGGIPADGHVNITMGFMPQGADNFLNHSILGEAPQLSIPYGSRDNGGEVFDFYDNFTAPSSLWATNMAPQSISMNQGLVLVFSGNSKYFVSNETFGPGTAFDTYINTFFDPPANVPANATAYADPEDTGYINIGEQQNVTGNLGWSTAAIRAACGNLYPDQISPLGEANPCGYTDGAFYSGSFPGGVYTVTPLSASSSLQYINYSTLGTTQPISIDAPTYPTGIGYAQIGAGNQNEVLGAYWARVRNSPPNGVMPSYNISPLSAIAIPVNVSNTQNFSTQAPFQADLNIDSAAFPRINANWSNVEFNTGPNGSGTVLQAWVESGSTNSSTDTVVWVRLPASIPAHGNVTIYMDILPSPVMSAAGPTGEAPQLSPSYAEFDNGAKVFDFYDNFAGTKLSSAWNANVTGPFPGLNGSLEYCILFNATGGCRPPFFLINASGDFTSQSLSGPFARVNPASLYSVDDGLTINATAMPNFVISLRNKSSSPIDVDTYGYATENGGFGSAFSDLQTNSDSFNFAVNSGALETSVMFSPINGTLTHTEEMALTYFNSTYRNVTYLAFPYIIPINTSVPQVMGLAVNSTSAQGYLHYYYPTLDATYPHVNGTSLDYPGITVLGAPQSFPQVHITWFRTRAYYLPDGTQHIIGDPPQNATNGNVEAVQQPNVIETANAVMQHFWHFI